MPEETQELGIEITADPHLCKDCGVPLGLEEHLPTCGCINQEHRLFKEMINQLIELRRDLHWLLGGQLAGRKRIADENGCSCEYFRDLKHEGWECALHGRVEKTGKWED